MWLWDIPKLVRPKSMLDQLPVFFLITDHDRSRVDFNDLTFNPKVLDRDVIAVSQLRHSP